MRVRQFTAFDAFGQSRSPTDTDFRQWSLTPKLAHASELPILMLWGLAQVGQVVVKVVVCRDWVIGFLRGLPYSQSRSVSGAIAQ